MSFANGLRGDTATCAASRGTSYARRGTLPPNQFTDVSLPDLTTTNKHLLKGFTAALRRATTATWCRAQRHSTSSTARCTLHLNQWTDVGWPDLTNTGKGLLKGFKRLCRANTATWCRKTAIIRWCASPKNFFATSGALPTLQGLPRRLHDRRLRLWCRGTTAPPA